MSASRWIPAVTYHPQPDHPLVIRPRLAVVGSAGIIWVGQENPRSWAAARKLAAYLNRRGREASRIFESGELRPTTRLGKNRKGRGRG